MTAEVFVFAVNGATGEMDEAIKQSEIHLKPASQPLSNRSPDVQIMQDNAPYLQLKQYLLQWHHVADKRLRFLASAKLPQLTYGMELELGGKYSAIDCAK